MAEPLGYIPPDVLGIAVGTVSRRVGGSVEETHRILRSEDGYDVNYRANIEGLVRQWISEETTLDDNGD